MRRGQTDSDIKKDLIRHVCAVAGRVARQDILAPARQWLTCLSASELTHQLALKRFKRAVDDVATAVNDADLLAELEVASKTRSGVKRPREEQEKDLCLALCAAVEACNRRRVAAMAGDEQASALAAPPCVVSLGGLWAERCVAPMAVDEQALALAAPPRVLAMEEVCAGIRRCHGESLREAARRLR